MLACICMYVCKYVCMCMHMHECVCEHSCIYVCENFVLKNTHERASNLVNWLKMYVMWEGEAGM